MSSILDSITQTATSTWDTVSGGFEQWVGAEVSAQVDNVGDGSRDPTSQPGAGYRTTGSPPADGSRGGGAAGAGGNGGGGLGTLASVVGIIAGGVTLFRYLK